MLLLPYSAAQLCKRLESDMLLIVSPVLSTISVYSDQTFLPLTYKANMIVFAAF